MPVLDLNNVADARLGTQQVHAIFCGEDRLWPRHPPIRDLEVYKEPGTTTALFFWHWYDCDYTLTEAVVQKGEVDRGAGWEVFSDYEHKPHFWLPGTLWEGWWDSNLAIVPTPPVGTTWRYRLTLKSQERGWVAAECDFTGVVYRVDLFKNHKELDDGNDKRNY